MLEQTITKNDRKAHIAIWILSSVVFCLIFFLEKYVNLDASSLGFDPHIFAMLSALVNSGVALGLIWALILVKKKNYEGHKKVMLGTMVLSIFFLIFYIAHHLFTGQTSYGDLNHDGILSIDEETAAGSLRYIYYFIIATHIVLAGIIMPFVLYTAYRALVGEYSIHKKLARWTFPIWLYVAITGVLVYVLISPYYS